jgi:hypothetical protein
MRLNEMFSDLSNSVEQDDQRIDAEQDNTALKLTDTRKTRLTLAHISKLRLMNELRAIENKQKIQKVKIQYGAPPAQPGM